MSEAVRSLSPDKPILRASRFGIEFWAEPSSQAKERASSRGTVVLPWRNDDNDVAKLVMSNGRGAVGCNRESPVSRGVRRRQKSVCRVSSSAERRVLERACGGAEIARLHLFEQASFSEACDGPTENCNG